MFPQKDTVSNSIFRKKKSGNKRFIIIFETFYKKNCYLYKVKAFYNKANWHINLIINP